MTIQALYEGLERPENLTNIKVFDNPVDAAISAYKIWLPITKIKSGDLHIYVISEQLYNEAVPLIEPHKKLFSNIKADQLETILKNIKPEDTNASGLFVSAMLNETDLKELDGVFNHEILGYRLAPEKTLIVREGSYVSELGLRMQGTLINYGEAETMGTGAENGIQVNYGLVRHHFGLITKGGVQINFGNFRANMAIESVGGVQLNYDEGSIFAVYSRDGMQINFGEVDSMSEGVVGGMQINYNKVIHQMSSEVKGGIQINMGEVKEIYSSDESIQHNLGTVLNDFTAPNKSSMKKDHPLFKELEEKLNEIDYIKQLNGNNEAIKAIKGHNWKKFEDDVLGLKKEIENVLK